MIQDSEFSSQAIPLSKILAPLKAPLREYWHLAALTIVCGWGKFVLPMGLPFITGHLIDNVIPYAAGPEARAELIRLGMISVVLIAVIAVATYFRTALAQKLASHLQHQLRRRLFHHIQRLGMSFFYRHHAGSLGSRVSSDITHAGVVVDKGLIQLSMDGVSLTTLSVVMFLINPLLAILSLLLLGCNGLIVLRFSPEIRRGRKEIQEGQSSVTGRAAEYFSAISVVKAYAGEQESGENFSLFSENVRDLQVANSKLQGAFQSASHSLLIATQIIIALVGTWLILERPESITPGNLVQFLLFSGLINGSVQRLTESLIQIQDGLAALERIHDILALTPNPQEPEAPLFPKLYGNLSFQKVCFGYTDKRVLHDFSFNFTAGKTYALVGRSGSGKSTLIQLALRFFDPQEGEITLEGVPLSQINLGHFRSNVATVLQDPILFSSSIRDNIGFAADHPDHEAIERAARAAQAHEFILDMPQGYDSRVGERGVSLSGGQRQRVAIARALMRDPRILILDEATSALDSLIERGIQDVIEALHGSRTVIIIAHRLSTIRHVDEVLVLENGHLVEHGPYQELKNKGGAFSHLLEEQTLAVQEQ